MCACVGGSVLKAQQMQMTYNRWPGMTSKLLVKVTVRLLDNHTLHSQCDALKAHTVRANTNTTASFT